MNLEEFTIEEEEHFQMQARYVRQICGKCPAQREYKGEKYCSRVMGCDKYSGKGWVYIPEDDQIYSRCKFLEKLDSRVMTSGFRKI